MSSPLGSAQVQGLMPTDLPKKQVFQSLLLRGQLDWNQYLWTYHLFKIPGDLHKYYCFSKIQQQLLVTVFAHETYMYNIQHTYIYYIYYMSTHTLLLALLHKLY